MDGVNLQAPCFYKHEAPFMSALFHEQVRTRFALNADTMLAAVAG